MQAKKIIKLLPLIMGTGASFVNGCNYNNKVTPNITIETNTDIIDDNIKSKEDIINEYQTYFNKEIEYHNEELYLKDEDIDNIINNSNIKPKYDYEFNGDINSIIDDIKNNSIKVIDDNLISAFNEENKDMLESVLKDIFNKIKQDNNNLNSDFHIIADLKIYTFKEVGIYTPCVYMEESNAIIINYSEIKELSGYYNISYEEQLKYFLIQEINKIRKITHKDDVESNLNYKSTNDTLLYDGTNGLELYTKKRLYDKSGEHIYNDEIKAQGELLLLGIANNDKDILDNYFNAVNDNNLKELWKVYNLKDKDDLKHFYKILYSMDAKLNRNPMIYDYYNSSSNADFEDFVGYEYKIDLFTRSVNNLMKYQKVNDISIQDNLVLYNIILNAIVNDTYKYDDNYEIIYNPFFMKQINELNNKYINYLSEYYNISIDDINYLIKYDIRFILIDMASIMHNDSDFIPEYINEAHDMLDKYPLSKAIMASDYIYTTQFQKALDNTNKNTKNL